MKKKEVDYVKLLSRELILDEQEARALDKDIKLYIQNNGLNDMNLLVENYIACQLKNTARYKKDNCKIPKKKCDSIARKYLSNNSEWIFFEGLMCVVSFIISLVSMIDICIRDCCEQYEKNVSQDGLLLIVSLVAVIIALLVNRLRKQRPISIFVDIFNRYSPTIIFMSVLFFYMARVFDSFYGSIGAIIFWMLFLGYILFFKCGERRMYDK